MLHFYEMFRFYDNLLIFDTKYLDKLDGTTILSKC